MNFDDFDLLYSDTVGRNEILAMPISPKEIHQHNINVWRNTGYEPFSKLIEKFLAKVNIKVVLRISGYDSSFDLRTRAKDCDLDIFLIDALLLNSKELIELLKVRFAEIYSGGSHNILLVIISEQSPVSLENDYKQLAEDFPQLLTIFLTKELSEDITSNFIDLRLNEVTSSPISPKWHVRVAREIALRGIYCALTPKTKLLAIDFDNTLISGVIGEDTISELTQNIFQKELINLINFAKTRGIMTALVSRNRKEDVIHVMDERTDFGLTTEMFDFYFCSWEPKESLISDLLGLVRIGADTCIFIDDNPTELIRVKNKHPEIIQILANRNKATTNALSSLLNINTHHTGSNENSLRAADILSNSKRESIFESTNLDEALKILEPVLEFFVDEDKNINRAVELSTKTNQFNLSLSRFAHSEIEYFQKSEYFNVVLGSLRDNLADSGLISLLVVERIGTSEIEVKEFNISCRAIGRGLESAIFEKSLRSISYSRDEYPIKVYVTYKAGPRNSPVLEWMKSLRFLETEGRFVIHLEETRSLNEK